MTFHLGIKSIVWVPEWFLDKHDHLMNDLVDGWFLLLMLILGPPIPKAWSLEQNLLRTGNHLISPWIVCMIFPFLGMRNVYMNKFFIRVFQRSFCVVKSHDCQHGNFLFKLAVQIIPKKKVVFPRVVWDMDFFLYNGGVECCGTHVFISSLRPLWSSCWLS